MTKVVTPAASAWADWAGFSLDVMTTGVTAPPVSFAIFELIRTRDGDTAPGAWSEQDVKGAALALEGVIKQHAGVVEWQSNPDVQRLMRRDIKRGLRPSGDYTETQLDELANRIVELAQHRRG